MMASITFTVGETFSSFSEFDTKIQAYQKANCVQFWRRDSRTIEKAAIRMTNRNFKNELKYAHLTYSCIHGGRNYKGRGEGQRNNSTFRMGCPASIKLNTTTDGQNLVVAQFSEEHTHPVNQELYQNLFHQRKLNDSETETVAQMLRDKANRKIIQTKHYCNHDGNGSVSAEAVISPIDPSVSENDPVSLTCTLTGTTGTVTGFAWYYQKSSDTAVNTVGILTSSCGASSIVSINTTLYGYVCPSSKQSTWTIKKVTRQNQGDTYWCKIASSGNPESQSGFTSLNVQVPISSVTMTVPSTSTVTVRENESEEFKCKTSGGLPAATVTWYKDAGTPDDSSDDVEITSNKETSFSTVNDLIEVTSTLSYSPTRNDNGWRIYCTASNANGQTPVVSQRKLLLNVQYPPNGPPVITGYTDGGEYRVIEGNQGQLSCTVSGGNPAPTLTWDCINSGTSQTTSSGTVTKTHTWTAQRGQDKTCTCRASHYSKNTEVPIRITILYQPTPPTFKIKSNTVSGTIEVIRDNSLSVTCISKGQPAPSYKWTKPDVATSNGQQLSVSNVQTNGRYTCDVQNTMNPSEGATVPGSNSSFIDVLILYPPTLPTFNYWNTSGHNIPTRAVDVIKGDTFKVACKSTGEPTPTYQWNNQGTNQILTVNNITADQSRTCTATNTMSETVGQTLSRSATATLSINVLYPPSAVTMKYHYGTSSEVTLTSSLSIIEGNPLKFTCSSDSKPAPTYKWTGSVSLPNATVRFDNTNRSQTGTVTCEVENTMTRTFANPEKEKTGTTTGSFNLNILYPPVLGELRNTSVVEGSPSTVSCPVTVGNPPNTAFNWSRNGQVWKRTQSFTIDSTSRTDAMLYTCTAANVMQQTGGQPVSQPDTKSFYLNVWYSTIVTEFLIVGHKGETSVTMNETKPVSFQCNVDSNPESSLSVIYDEHTQHSQTNTKSVTYSIPSAACTDSGVYSCVGFNQYNKNSSTRILNLFINCSPRPSPFVTLKENVTSELHKPAVLTFTTLAYPEPKAAEFKWYRWNNSEWLPISNSGQFKVNTSNLQTNLTITDVNRTYLGMYRLEVENTIGSWEQIFYLEPEDVPEMPADFRHEAKAVTESSVTVQWTPGFDNGPDQTFMLRYKKVSDNEWRTVSIPDKGDPTMNYTISELSSGTEYHVVLYANNRLGNSTETEVLKIKTKASTPPSPTALIGGVAGGVSAVVFIIVIGVVVVVFRRRRGSITKGKSQKRDDRNDRKPVCEDDDDDYGMQDNPMYVSAGPSTSGNPSGDSAAVYSTVDKTKTAAANTGNDVYAEVDKTKKTRAKQEKKEKEKTSKQGFFKDKKGKKHAQEGDVYENAPATELKATRTKLGTNDEIIYENPEPSKAVGKKNVNKDGLIYADLTFNDQPKGQKKLVIHGLDDMTEYVEVDFTKKADPLPDSDDETSAPKK